MKLFEKIAQELSEDILSGKLQAEEKLPSVREFAKAYNVSHVTSSNVLKKLEDDGLIRSTPKGYVVRSEQSDFVRDYYRKKIESAYFDILDAQKKLGYSDGELAEYLTLLKGFAG